jgi:murein DD-endopeptidase MepM/ murein hydrolase activator NlpD
VKDVLKWTFGCMAVPLLCGAAFVVAYVLIVALTIPQLPAWARPGVYQWLMDIPQDSDYGLDDGNGGSAPAGVGVGWDDYSGPDGDIYGLPLVGPIYHWGYLNEKPILGCTFHDPYYSSHTGVDFPVDEGTPVYATMGGKVIYADWNGPWGNLVVIQNGDYQIWLAHLSVISVSQGDILGHGDLVGLSGNTGNSTGGHVHYGIKHRTPAGSYVWLNPQNFFTDDLYIQTGCSD